MQITTTAAVLTALLSSPALGQHVPETEPRAGEQRFNAFQYHAIHNSFIRGTTLEEQVDYWGAVQLELDVWYDNGEFDVQHNSCDTVGEDTLANYLDDLNNSQALQSGFIIINFQLHEDGTGACSQGFSPFPSDWITQIRGLLEQYLGASSFYTFAEFRDVDGLRWPSLQELLRRDKHVMVLKTSTYDDFYFNTQVISDCGSEWEQDPSNTRVHINTGEDSHCWDLGDRWLSRTYPSAQLCFEESDDGWSEDVDRGFTFVATNCDTDAGRITDPRIHPPVPLYVDDVPFGEQLGTWWRPYAGTFGLLNAVNRLKAHEDLKGPSNVPIVLESGFAHVTFGSFESDPPYMTITTRGGPVTITN